MATRTRLTVEFDSDRTEHVHADQRDWMAAEQAQITSDTMHTWLRWLAWHALKRTGRYALSWEAFNAEVVEVASAPPEEPAGDDDGLDPGLPGTHAGS